MTSIIEKEAKSMVLDAIDCSHGEIFEECYRDGKGISLKEASASVLECALIDKDFAAGTREAAEEARRDPTDEKLMHVLVLYFSEYPTHGECAGVVCGALIHMKKFSEVSEILSMCTEMGKGFGWDS